MEIPTPVAVAILVVALIALFLSIILLVRSINAKKKLLEERRDVGREVSIEYETPRGEKRRMAFSPRDVTSIRSFVRDAKDELDV
jgi:hypothetical protein